MLGDFPGGAFTGALNERLKCIWGCRLLSIFSGEEAGEAGLEGSKLL
jgi:hypothetical protein